jgi:hypothetical protein
VAHAVDIAVSVDSVLPVPVSIVDELLRLPDSVDAVLLVVEDDSVDSVDVVDVSLM